jgi:hypothetical protein
VRSWTRRASSSAVCIAALDEMSTLMSRETEVGSGAWFWSHGLPRILMELQSAGGAAKSRSPMFENAGSNHLLGRIKRRPGRPEALT